MGILASRKTRNTPMCGDPACESAARAKPPRGRSFGFALLAIGKGAKLVLGRSQPAESAADLALFAISLFYYYHHAPRLPFDPRMPVL